MADETKKKKTTRRALSLKGLTYQRLKDWCDENGRSVSGFVEELVTQRLDELGVPTPKVLRPRKPTAPKTADEIISQHFTF